MHNAHEKQKNWQGTLAKILIFLSVWGFLALGIRMASGDIVLGADYYTFYTAARMYLLEGANPYSEEVTQMAQLGIMGRLANPDEDQMAFAYPFFMLFLVIPFAWMDISISQAIWMSFNILVFLTTVFYIFQEEKLFIVLSVLFYPFWYGIIIGNFSTIICSVILFSLYLLIYRKNGITLPGQLILGFLLSWTISKPQLSSLLLFFATLISIQKRYYFLVISFIVSIISLILLSYILMPEWLIFWFKQLEYYAMYNKSIPSHLIYSIFSFTGLPPEIFFYALLVISFIVFIVWYKINFIDDKTKPIEKNINNIYICVILIIITTFLMPRTASNDQLLLLLAIFLGSKVYIRQKEYRVVLGLIWTTYTIFSWLTFILSPYINLPLTNIIYPFAIALSWLLIFSLLYFKTIWWTQNYAPS